MKNSFPFPATAQCQLKPSWSPMVDASTPRSRLLCLTPPPLRTPAHTIYPAAATAGHVPRRSFPAVLLRRRCWFCYLHFNSGLFNLIPTLLPVGTTTLHLFRWNQTSSAATIEDRVPTANVNVLLSVVFVFTSKLN